MLSNLNKFKSDLKNYSKIDLLIMAKYLYIDTEIDLDTIIDNIAMNQVSTSNRSNMELSDLPSELVLQIVQNLDIDAIGKLCTTSSQYSWVCNFPGTWKYIFNKELAINNNTDYNYKQAVMEIYKIKDLDKKYLAVAEKGYLKLLVKLDSQQDKKIRLKALLSAAENGHLEIIKYLSKNGVDIHNNDDSVFLLAAENGHLDIVRYLIENVDINKHILREAFSLAAGNGHLNVVKYLFKKVVDIFGTKFSFSSAVENGHLDVVRYLIENGVDIHNNDDYALITSAEYGHLDVVRYLIENGANIHANNDYALKLAADNGHLEVVMYLLENGANKNVLKKLKLPSKIKRALFKN